MPDEPVFAFDDSRIAAEGLRIHRQGGAAAGPRRPLGPAAPVS
ncbi:hypothetical protein [Nonomuraea sp. NPDC003804]